jgi:hypothetical protein
VIKIKKILAFKNYLLFYLLIILILDLILTRLPLTKVFGYEYSVLNSMLLVFLSGLSAITLLKRSASKEEGELVLNVLLYSFISFIILPVIVSITHSFFTIKCSLLEGFLFYLVLTVPSVVIGGSLGFLISTLFRKFRIIIFIIVYILILIIPICDFYFDPQVYFYNPIFGFLPGTIYDEGLSVDLKLAGYRFLNLIFFGGIFYFANRIRFSENNISKKFLFILVLLIPALFIYISPDLKYSTNKTRIEKELTGEITSPHFIIHYPSGIDPDLIKDIAIHHEYYYRVLSEFFNVTLNKKIESFLFLDDVQKKGLFGSGNADVAKPWLLQIYLSYRDYNTTLKHELAHCFTSAFGSGIFKIADDFNPYLIEGAAVAADPVYDENYIHYMAALAYQNNYKIKIKDLFNFLSFFEQTSSISYIYAGSFSKFLIEKYGIEKYKKLYQDINFEQIYHLPLDTLSKKYTSFIDSLKTYGTADKANYYFGRQSIFYKVCPRYIADKLSDAWALYGKKKYNDAKIIFKDIFGLGANYSALIGMAQCDSKLDNRDKAIKLLEKNLYRYRNTAYYYSIEFQLGDLLGEGSNYSGADSNFTSLIYQNPNRTFYYLSQLRKTLLKDSLISLYLKGNEFDKFQIIKSINEKNYDYNSIPVFIDLARNLVDQYELFIKNFNKTIHVNGYSQSYAIYKLSIYMLENLDFSRARKMAALALRYNSDKNFNYIIESNFKKTDWFYYHGNEILEQLKIK